MHPLLLGQACINRRHLHILRGTFTGNQVIALKHEAEGFTTQPGQGVRVQQGHVLPLKPIATFARFIKAAQDIHQGGLARTGAANDGHILTRANIQINAVQHRHRWLIAHTAIVLANAAQRNQRNLLHRTHHCSHRRPPGIRVSPTMTRSPSATPSSTCT